MSVFLILFLIAASGIILLVGRKMLVLKHSQYSAPADFDFLIEIPDFDELKNAFHKKSRRYGYIALVLTIRTYVITSHVLKRKSETLWQWLKRRLAKKNHPKAAHDIDNKFLTRISEYKKRIRRIKERIKEEEGLN